MKFFFYDLETTGTDVGRHGVHQIAAIISTPKGETELNYQCRPKDGCMVSPEALEICKVTLEELRKYPLKVEAYADLVQHLNKGCDRFDKTDKFFLVGYNNSPFDNQFFRQWFKDNDDEYFGSYFWPNSLDVMVMATQALMEKRPLMENFKLHTVARELGLEVDEDQLHDALYDVRLTKQMFEILTAPKQKRKAA